MKLSIKQTLMTIHVKIEVSVQKWMQTKISNTKARFGSKVFFEVLEEFRFFLNKGFNDFDAFVINKYFNFKNSSI